MARSRSFADMRVVITGASSGIGAGLARALAQRGAKVAVCARRADKLKTLTDELGSGHLGVVADVSIPDDCQRFISEAHQALGGIDTLVCNAGYALVRTVAETTAAEWEAILRTNLLGTSECVRAVVPMLRTNPLRNHWRGQIVVISSALARRGKPHAGAYSATKAAQLSLCEALRVELMPEHIAVTSVHPIYTATEIAETAQRVSGNAWFVSPSDPVQDVATVANAIVRGIERPRPEVWPHRSSRIALALCGFMPGIVDGIMARRFPR